MRHSPSEKPENRFSSPNATHSATHKQKGLTAEAINPCIYWWAQQDSNL